MPCPAFSARARLWAAAAAVLVGSTSSLAAPPATPVRDVTQVLHGTTVHDLYRDLEDVKSPATQAWLKAQGEYAEQALAALPDRQALTQRVDALSRDTGDVIRQVVHLPGDRLFYLKRAAGQAQFKLVTRAGLAGAERVLVDPEQLAKRSGVPHAINYFVPSWDGRSLAYGISAGGSEDASLYLMDVASGQAIGQPIPRVQQDLVHWAPDSRHVAYNQLRELPAGTAPTETFLDTTVHLLRVGAKGAQAQPIFGPLAQPDLKLDRLDVASVSFHPSSRFMLARTTDTTVPEGKLFVAPVAELGRGGRIAWRQVSAFADGITDARLHGNTLYLRTHKGAPRGRWLALDLAKGGAVADARTVIDEPARGVLQGLVIGHGGTLYAEVQEGFGTRTWRFSAGQAPVDMGAGQAGSTYAIDDPAHAHHDLWLQTSAWTEPSRILRSTGPGRPLADTGLLRNRVPAGTPALTVSEVLVPSHDGAQVPLAILHRADLKPGAGPHPTLLIGYGAYGFSMEAYFNPRSLAWLERGGVLALANPRGSGAFGDAWHRAGFKTTKPNTWKDGIACAKYLIAQGYASPKTLGIWGTSAGGVFVGRAVTEAPELFAAAIFDVGIMDAVRAEESANGITNISEFGTVKDPVEFKALLEMSTYHQIKDGVAYPAVLFIHGINDPRVDVWQSAKAAARLQAASTSGKPVLLRLDGQAGHGVGSTAGQQSSKLGDLYAFLLAQFKP